MRRWINIFVFVFLATMGVAQETRIVDSLQAVLATQEGREKVLTMIELTWDFYDISFDDCIDWGEKAIKEANALGLKDLEAKANYVLGIQYAHHADLDLAKEYLRKSYSHYEKLSDTANRFESLWSIATYELFLGSMDSAFLAYNEAFQLAKQLNDSVLMANVFSNLAYIHYQQNEFSEALNCYHQVKRYLGDKAPHEQLVLQAESNIATIYSDQGKWNEAYKTFVDLIPKLEANKDYYLLVTAYLNLGIVYENGRVNYDSAMICFKKGLECADQAVPLLVEKNSMRRLKSDLLSEMGELYCEQGLYNAALNSYNEALSLAENESHLSGQMKACIGLGKLFSQLGNTSKSMLYFNRYFELEQKTGITILRQATRCPMMLNYARMGRYDDLERDLRNLDDERADLVRENAGLHDRNHELEETVENLAARVEQQDQVNEAQQAQLKRYRMAFFGLLSIALLFIVLLVAREIVRKNRGKSA